MQIKPLGLGRFSLGSLGDAFFAIEIIRRISSFEKASTSSTSFFVSLTVSSMRPAFSRVATFELRREPPTVFAIRSSFEDERAGNSARNRANRSVAFGIRGTKKHEPTTFEVRGSGFEVRGSRFEEQRLRLVATCGGGEFAPIQ